MERDIRQACEVLERGGLILYPTDTVWGIGCDAANAEAVRKVYDLKRRSDSKALIVLVGSRRMLDECVADVPDSAKEFLSGKRPTTLVLDSPHGLASNLLATDGSVGLRVSHEAFSSALCQEFGRPIVSTSANISGTPSPASFAEISDEIKAGVDYVCTSRRDDDGNGIPSRIVKIDMNGGIQIIRP
ncbi:MAG: L-threonylcarbamoyladenylate synthase [Muribaculum sp.]|nr:L-threonylcarbamoyladenylate synthase [Muribaculum sp.]